MITEYGCDPADVATWSAAGAPSVDESPIFIVAFPRSGTTLLELTLDAHPQLQSMDEQPFLQNALEDLVANGVRYPQQLGRLDAQQLDSVRARYWERVARKVKLQPGQRLVDKNPLNLLRLPVIRRMFPNSRIILAVRHPCDVLMSCYMQHFRAPEFALLCNDLHTLAQGYRRSFDFWYEQAAILQPAAREVRYETFVATSRARCAASSSSSQLPWNDALLAPGAASAGKGIHQHAELLAGRAAHQLEVRGALARVRAAPQARAAARAAVSGSLGLRRLNGDAGVSGNSR